MKTPLLFKLAISAPNGYPLATAYGSVADKTEATRVEPTKIYGGDPNVPGSLQAEPAVPADTLDAIREASDAAIAVLRERLGYL